MCDHCSCITYSSAFLLPYKYAASLHIQLNPLERGQCALKVHTAKPSVSASYMLIELILLLTSLASERPRTGGCHF